MHVLYKILLANLFFSPFTVCVALSACVKSDKIIFENDATYVSRRPPFEQRLFTSKLVEKEINKVAKKIIDPKLRWLFINCFPNTLDTTVKFRIRDGHPDTFVITGDINAMWLRDSSAQVQNYCKHSINYKF